MQESVVSAAWLGRCQPSDGVFAKWAKVGVVMDAGGEVLKTAGLELSRGLSLAFDQRVPITSQMPATAAIWVGTAERLHALSWADESLRSAAAALIDSGDEAYLLRTVETGPEPMVCCVGASERGALYGVFALLRKISLEESMDALDVVDAPVNPLRMVDHWDNIDGSVERGYAGRSLFFRDGQVLSSSPRIGEYARLLASVGINAIAINNVNVHRTESQLITEAFLPAVAELARNFRRYGIRLFLSANFASPIEIGGLATADPLDPEVRRWWKHQSDIIYDYLPNFGGYLVKADSEFRPGPFTYGRDHADGANMLAEALGEHGGLVIWRCFVYDCLMDWRNRKLDRARAAYDHFVPLDGRFDERVVLQIKNGPMDFQVREPVSPLLGAMAQTNQVLEFQLTQEYTGQQRDLCYLVPQWKAVLEFDTYACGPGSTIAEIASGALHQRKRAGIAGVANVGDDGFWTGHPLAQANLYGFGRLCWNPGLSTQAITHEWIVQTLGADPELVEGLTSMLLASWPIYEHYTAPLGIGWMVNPGHHYGPNVDGYEYSKWGTYHFADHQGIGVDRTVETGSGYVAQYREPNREMYQDVRRCPDELLLFFHHVSYQHRLKSGKTVIQHIYDTHFQGVQEVGELVAQWQRLAPRLPKDWAERGADRLQWQQQNAQEWCDVVNTYFYRKSHIADEQGRPITP